MPRFGGWHHCSTIAHDDSGSVREKMDVSQVPVCFAKVAPVPDFPRRGLRIMTGVVVAAGRGLGGPPLPPPRHPGESRTGGCSGKSICDPVSSVSWMTGDLPVTPAGRMMKPWQQHPLSRESPSSPGNAGDDRAFATCVFASKTFLKCLLLGRQRIRFLLTTLIWSGRTSARASSTPPSISTILSSSARRMRYGSSSMPSCRHRWHGS